MVKDVELIAVDNKGFYEYTKAIKSSKRRQVIFKYNDETRVDRALTFSLKAWELALQKLLADVFEESEKRVLRYRSSSKTMYREFDFVGVGEGDSYFFIEIKTASKSRYAGLPQLKKSLSIAEKGYNVAGGVVMRVNMMEVYNAVDFVDNMMPQDEAEAILNSWVSDFKEKLAEKKAPYSSGIRGDALMMLAIEKGYLSRDDCVELIAHQKYKKKVTERAKTNQGHSRLTHSPFAVLAKIKREKD